MLFLSPNVTTKIDILMGTIPVHTAPRLVIKGRKKECKAVNVIKRLALQPQSQDTSRGGSSYLVDRNGLATTNTKYFTQTGGSKQEEVFQDGDLTGKCHEHLKILECYRQPSSGNR